MSFHLVLNPIACDGRGTCAELIGERIQMDDWGYPIVSTAELKGELVDYAEEACAACPTGALALKHT